MNAVNDGILIARSDAISIGNQRSEDGKDVCVYVGRTSVARQVGKLIGRQVLGTLLVQRKT